jgi:hypothetical protein
MEEWPEGVRRWLYGVAAARHKRAASWDNSACLKDMEQEKLPS